MSSSCCGSIRVKSVVSRVKSVYYNINFISSVLQQAMVPGKGYKHNQRNRLTGFIKHFLMKNFQTNFAKRRLNFRSYVV